VGSNPTPSARNEQFPRTTVRPLSVRFRALIPKEL
jgi:hypothetical protein